MHILIIRTVHFTGVTVQRRRWVSLGIIDHQSVPKHLIPSLKSSLTSVFERAVCGRRQRPSAEHPQEPRLEGTKRGQGAHLRMTRC